MYRSEKMNMKKFIAAVLSAAAVLSLAGCSGKEDTSNIWNMLTSGTSSASSSAGSTSTAGGTSSAASSTSAVSSSSSTAKSTSSVPKSSKPEESSAASDPTESKPAETNPVQVDWSTVPELDEMDIDYEVKEIKDIPEEDLKRYVTGLSDEAKKNGVVIIKAYYGNAEYIKIPQTIAGKNCIAVDINVNWGDNAKSIKYPDGFVCIYSNTSQLRNCGSGQAPNVTSVSLPDNLEYICGFDGLTSLEEITLPKKLKTIDDGSFSGLQKLKSVTIGENVERIGSAFYLCTALEKVNFPKKLNGQCEICSSFYGCSSLKSIELPEGADFFSSDEIYYDGSFSGCTALEKVFLPNTVTVLPGDTFSGCTALKEINLPSSLKTMECGFGGAFTGCTSLGKIDIPDSVTTIGSYTFGDCTALKEIIIPDGVTTVGSSAFDGCNEDIVIKYKGKTYNSKNVEKLYNKDLSTM